MTAQGQWKTAFVTTPPGQHDIRTTRKKDRKSQAKIHKAFRAVVLRTPTHSTASNKTEPDNELGSDIEEDPDVSAPRSHAETIIPKEVEHEEKPAVRPSLLLDTARNDETEPWFGVS